MASVTLDPTTEKCGMCLGSWASKRDVRILPCHHAFCLPCLEENRLLNKRTVCPKCRHDHGSLDVKSLEAVFQVQTEVAEINNICGTEGCDESSSWYCMKCEMQYCANHLKIHDQLISTHEVVEISEYRSREAERNPSYCQIHPNQALIVACERCYTMKCDQCEDQANEGCAENERHRLYTIGQVAGSLSSDIRRQLDEFRGREAVMSKMLKDVLSQGDSIGEDMRTMLSTVDETAANMKAEIDLQAGKLKKEVSDYHGEITLQIEAMTNAVNGFTDNSSDWSKSANKMLRKSKADIIRGSSELSDRARLILNTECPEFEPVLKTLRRSGKEEKLIFPLSLELNFLSPPSAARLKSSIQTPANCYTLTHLTTGQLVHAGRYNLTGSEFGVKYDGGSLYSLYEHAGCLYILQRTNGYKHIHMLNLSTGDCSYSVIKYRDGDYQSGLVVNDQHIITICVNTKAVKVFSSTDYSLQYDMKIDCLSRWALGIAQLPDGSLVVSDYSEGLVCKFTVDRNPTVNWICSDLDQLTGIAIDTAGNYILVASYNKKELHVLSFSGAAPSRWPWYEKLNEIVGRRPAAVSISDGVESHTTQETATQDTTTQDDDGDDDEATESSQFASGTPRPPKRKNAFKDRNQASSAKNSRKEPSQISELVEELREQNTQLGQQIDRCFEGQERMMTQFSEMMNMMMGTTQQTPAPQASPLHHPSSIAPSYHQQQPTQSYQHIPSSQSYQHSPQVPPTYQSYPQHMINFSPPPSRPASAFSPSGSSEGA